MLVDGTFAFVLVAALLAASGRALRVKDEGVTVALSPDVQQEKAAELLKVLKDQFQKASSVLCNATDGQFLFNTVRLILPKTWNETTISPSDFIKGNPLAWGKLSAPDILIGNGKTNDVQQTRGCGQLGDFITLSAETFKENTTYFDRLLATLLVRWRFGVFPEEAPGFHYHPDQKIIPNSCTNTALNWTAANQQCEPSITNKCEINIEDNVNVTSSLLYNYTLPNMHLFCNETNHNHYAPTPQNLLCNGQSIWEIMKLSDEFPKSKENDKKESDQKCSTEKFEVHYVIQNSKNIYILVAMDNLTSQMTSAIAAAVTAATQIIMESGDNLIIMYHNETVVNQTNINPKDTEMINNISLILTNEEHQSLSSNCLSCSVKEFKEIIKENESGNVAFIITNAEPPEPTVKKLDARSIKKPDTTKTTTTQSPKPRKPVETEESEIDESIKEIAQEENDENKDFDKLIDDFKNLTVTVHTLAIGNATVLKLEELATATGGHSYYVSDGNTFTEPVLLKSLINTLSSSENQVETIFSGVISEDETVKSFYIDGGYREVVAIVSRSATTEHVGFVSFKDEFEMQQGTCKKLSTNLSSAICNTNTSEPSWWWLMIELLKPQVGFQQSIDVFGLPTTDQARRISASAWFNDNSPKVNLSENILTVFAKVTDGEKPYTNATVTATFARDVNSTFELNLQDDGIAADLVKNDGIYSGYVQNCPNIGRYSAQIKIKGKCYKNSECTNESAEHLFERHLMVGSVVFTNCIRNIQKLLTSFPVRDLTVLHQSQKNFTLTWTHPKITDIQDATYELKSLKNWTKDVEKWKSEGTVLRKITNDDKIHQETVSWDSSETAVYVALLVGYEKKYFAISNILALPTYAPPATTVTPTVTSPSAITEKKTTEQETSKPTLTSETTSNSDTTEASSPQSVQTPDEVSGSSNSAAAGIIAVVIILAIAAVAGLSYYFVYYRRRAYHNSSPSVGYSNLE